MNQTPRLSKSGIEYLDYMWGVWSGCQNWQNGVCGSGSDFNCWAKSLATRFKNIYPNGFEPTFYPEAIDSPRYLKKPSRIGVGWVGDVIGYASPAIRIAICDAIKQCPQHSFLFLTKNPERLIEWEFPDNCQVGVTLTSQTDADRTFNDFAKVEATIKYVSLEPLLGRVDISPYLKGWVNAGTIFENPEGVERYDVDGALVNHIDWVIIGAQTKPTVYPKIEWVQEIIQSCRQAGIPIFLKNNLLPILEGRKLIQEMPNA